jgi:hypothetical protein
MPLFATPQTATQPNTAPAEALPVVRPSIQMRPVADVLRSAARFEDSENLASVYQTAADDLVSIAAQVDDTECKLARTAARVRELEAALEEIANGPFGKSAAVKRIAREALKGGAK